MLKYESGDMHSTQHNRYRVCIDMCRIVAETGCSHLFGGCFFVSDLRGKTMLVMIKC